MAEQTGIEWCDHTFNPWIGCTKVSAACDHCYAEALMDHRHHRVTWGGERSLTSDANWRQPRRWNAKAKVDGVRRRVFCASIADVFDNQVPEDWRHRLWALIARCPDLDWLLLTKRPQNIAKMLPGSDALQIANKTWPWPHVWLGTTAENQEEADRRIPHLLTPPAARRFLSCEPLLGPIRLCNLYPITDDEHGIFVEGAHGSTPRLDWVIAGGESGPGARAMHPAWARALRDQCHAAGVPYFFKQWGEWISDPQFGDRGHDTSMIRVGKKAAGRLLDGVEHSEFPA